MANVGKTPTWEQYHDEVYLRRWYVEISNGKLTQRDSQTNRHLMLLENILEGKQIILAKCEADHECYFQCKVPTQYLILRQNCGAIRFIKYPR